MPIQRLQPNKIHPRLGMMTQVEDTLIPDSGYVKRQINMHSDIIGKTTVRKGLTQIGSQIVNNQSIIALYNFRDSGSGTNNQLLAVIYDGSANNDIYYDNAGTWTKTLEDDTSNVKTRFTTFGDRVIRVNASDNMKCWAGTGAWETSGNPINPDDMASHDCKFIETLSGRVFVAGETAKPDRLYFSDLVDSSGNITWTNIELGDGSDDSGFIDVNPSDGDNITGLKRYASTLLIFKKNYMYRLQGTGLSSTVDPDPIINIGTYSQESIVEGKGGIYFHHPKGFFVYAGGFPKEISKPIQDWVDAIDVDNYEDIVGWADRDHIYWSVGDVTVDGISFTNIVLCYTISSDIWFAYSYPTEIKAACQNLGTSTTNKWEQVIGDDDGNVYQFNTGNDDDGTVINFEIITHFYNFGLVSITKNIDKLLVVSNQINDAVMSWQSYGEPEDQWHPLGQLNEAHKFIVDQYIEGLEIRFRISGSNNGEQGYLRFIEIINNLSEGVLHGV